MNLEHVLPNLELISVGATKELELKNGLYNMIDDWKDIKFPIGTFKETNLSILSNLDDIQVC